MNICIMTEGGSRMGLGHLSRCLALAQAMKRLKKKAKIRFIVNGDKAAKSFLQKCGVKPVISDWIKDKKKTISHSKASKVIIIDSYRAPSSFYSSLAHLKPRPRLVAIDDYHRLDYETDMVINPSVHGQDRYIILRKEFHAAKAKRVREHIKDVLITFGGTISYFHFAKRLISMLIKKFPDFNYHILMRSGSLLSKSNSALTDKARIKVYSNLTAARLRDLMLKMDLCISGGGQTLYELARCGVPTIGVCFANNQILNLTSMRKRGFLCYAGYYKSEEIFENICKYIKVLSVKKIGWRQARLAGRLSTAWEPIGWRGPFLKKCRRE